MSRDKAKCHHVLLNGERQKQLSVYLAVTDKGKRDAINLLDEDKPDTEEQETIEAIRKRQAII